MESLWKKLIIFSLLSVSTLTHARDTEMKVQRKINRLNRILQKIESNLYRMNERKLMEINQNLATSISLLSFRSGPRPFPPTPIPGPQPIPNPLPPSPFPPFPGYVTVSGSIEDQSFVFDVVDATDLAQKCVQKFKGINQVDDATVSVNFSQEGVLRNASGWWRSAGDVCARIADKAIKLGLKHREGYGFSAVGAIEAKSYSFSGATLKDVLLQCHQFYAREVNDQVDDIIIFNGLQIVKKRKVNGYWYGESEVCNIIIQEIR